MDEFLSGERPKKRGKTFMMDMRLDYANPSHTFKVATEDGIFRTHGKGSIVGHERSRLQMPLERSNFMRFALKFNSAKAGVRNMWVLPLMNYLGEFHQSHPDLDNHPLRIFRTPVLSGAL